MASEELQEPIEEKKDHEAIDLQAIHNPITTEYKKEQMEIKREILDGNVDVDKIIAEKPENFKNCTVNSQGDLEEEEVLKHEEASSSLEEPITQEEQEKVNGATGSELHSTQFTEVVLKGDEIPASRTPLVSEEVQEKIHVGEVVKEDAHQNQILNKDETEKDESQSSPNEVHEVPIGNTSQNPEEDVTKEVEILSSITSPIKEEVSEEAKEKENFIEEMQNEQVHQIEIAKENLAEENDCPEETEDQSRDIVSEVVVISEETIPEEAIQGSKTQEMISEEIKQNEETKATAKMEETSQIDSGENNPDKDLISYDLPTTNEETGKSNEESASVTPFISEEAKENIDIKEEAPQNQISKEDEAEKLSERDYQNETEKAIENTSENPEEDVKKEVGLKEVESSSSVTHPVSEEVLEEAKEKNEFPEEALKEQINQNEAAEENWAAEKECLAEEVQNRDVSEISEVKPIEESIAMSEKDETTQNDNGENATYKDSTSSHQPLANEETSKIDEGSEQISEEPTLETSTTRDLTPEIEIKDDKDFEKFEDEDEGKSSEEKQSKTSDAILKIEDETLNDSEEEKPDENDKLKHKETDKQEVKFCFETEEQLGESKASSSGEEVSAERDTVETETIKKTEEDEKNITQNEITLDSKETLNSEEVAHCDEKTREGKDGFDGDELGEGNREDEVDQGNIEESVEAVSAQLIKSEEALQETPNEGTTLSEMERVNTEYMVLNSERDNMEVENSHEDKPNGDQLVMEEATGQDGLKIASNDNEIETEKLEVGDTSSHGEEKASVTLQNDEELDLNVKPEEKTESETLTNEITQRVETIEEPCITQIKEEPFEVKSTIENNETPNEPSISAIQQDEQIQESRAKSIEANQATDNVSLEEGLEANTTLISSAKQGDARSIAKEEGATTQEENIIVETPKDEAEGAEELKESTEKQVEKIPQIANLTEVTEVELGQSETVGSEVEHLEIVSEDKKFAEESKLTDTDAKSAEMEITKDELMEQKEISREEQIDQTEIISKQDQPSQESDVKPTEPDQATDEVLAKENSDVTATLSSSVEQIGDRSTGKVEGVILQEENVVLEMPKEEAEEREEKIEETNEKNIEEEIRRTVDPEVCDAAEESQKFGTITKSPQLENMTEELASVEEKSDVTATLVPGDGQIIEISNEGSSIVPQSTTESVVVPEERVSREVETNEESSDKHIVGEPFEAESTIEHKETSNEPGISTIQQDEQSQQSDAKSIEANQVIDDIPLEKGLEDNATLISNAEQGDARSIAKEEGGTTQEENIIVETPKDEAEGAEELKESTEKQVEEIPQIANLSEVTEVELGQSEAVGSEAKHSEVVSEEKFAEERKLTDTDAKSAEMESTKDELMEQKEIEGQIDQTEIISEQDQPSQESDVKPIELDQATDEVSAEENSATAALSSSVEQIGERSTGKEEGVILQEENVVFEMPKEEAEEREEKIEEINEKHREEEIPQIVHPSEISQEQLVEGETVGSEAENLEVISNEKLVDESKLPENDVKSAQMENKSDKLIEEESNANLSSSVEQIRGEICTTVDPEIGDAAEESQKFGTVTESPELENVTEELASVEEKSDATSTLVPGEGQIMEISNEGSSDVLQSTTESVIVPEEEVSRGIETNEEPSDKHVLGEISKIADPEIESTELEKATEESDSAMEKTDATANLVPGEGHIEEIKIANEESGVGSQSTIESVTVPEERVYQGIETNEAPSDKHIVDELPEKDIPIDSLEAPEEITASPVEEPDYKNVGAAMESASLEKTNREIDVKAILEETSVEKSELIDEKIPSDVMLEVTNPASTEIEELQIREKASGQIIKENKETNEEIKAMKEEKIGMPSCDTVVTMPENQTKEEEVSEIGKISGEKEIPNVAFEKPVSGEINRDTDQKGAEENREFAADQEAEGQSENKESEGLEHGDFASIVSSFLINKVLSEETQKTDDDMKQNDDALFIPKAIDGETIQQEIRTNEREEIETTHEEISYATSSRREEEKMEIQEPKEEEGVEQDYLPVSRFLMDKIMRQEENKNLEKEEMVLMESRIQEEEENKVESSNFVVAPEQKGETTSSLTEVTRDLEKGENLIEEIDKSLDGDGGTSREEKIEENSSLATAPKQGGETSLSPIEVDRNFEEDKLTEDQKPKEEEKTTVSDVGISTVEKNAGENSNFVAVPEQEGETSLSPIEAVRDFEQEEKNSEVKNETVVSDEGMSMVEKIREENTGAVARPTDEIENTEGENSKVTVHEQKGETTTSSIVEEVKDSANSEQSKDLVNVPEISSTEKLIIPKEEEHKEDVKNLEENYVLVEREIDQFEEEPNEILEEGKVAKGTSNAKISNQEEKQTTLSAEIQDAEKNSIGVEVTRNEIEQRNLPDAVEILMAEIETKEEHLHEPLEKQGDQEDTKILKEEVTDTMVERIENKNQEKLTEQGATKEEKKSEEVKEEEQEEEEEVEEERHEEREAEIISTDVPVKAAVRETDTKPMQKKSHNILSGVGSKVKHSLAKVKKAITGKSKNVK